MMSPEPRRADAPSLVPARMINETLYCERLLYLEWVQGEFEDNAFTVEGRFAHRRADQPGGQLPEPTTEAAAKKPDDQDAPDAGGGDSGEETPAAERPYRARSVWLSSDKLGITAKIDVVDGEADGRVLPVEYKRGSPPDLPERAYLPERAQVCAQVLLLRDHGYLCDEGALYFAASRLRVPVVIEDTLISTTLEAVRRAKEIVAAGTLPPPLSDSPKCDGCSLVGICLPDETNLLREHEELRLPARICG